MPNSFWQLQLNTRDRSKAEILAQRCLQQMDYPYVDLKLDSYAKGGFLGQFQLNHPNDLSWSELVVEVIKIAQSLGGGWYLTGSAEDDLSGVLSTNSDGRAVIPGLLWAQWQVSKS